MFGTVALLVLLLGVFWARRRRIARHQQAALNGRLAPSQAYSNTYPQQGQQGQMYGYAPQQGYNNNGQQPQYYENQSQTYNYGPSAENWQPPPPKYEPPPPSAQNGFKGPEGGNNNGNVGGEQQGYNVGSNEGYGYAPPPGAPPGQTTASAQPQQGNENRV